MVVTPQMYRVIVIASLVLGVFSAFIDLIFPQAIPTPLNVAYNNWLNLRAGSPFPAAIVGIGFVVAGIAATVGLCLFKAWSRPLALLSTLGAIIGYPMVGPVLESGWTSLATYLSAVCWGAAIAFSYSEPISQRFAARAN